MKNKIIATILVLLVATLGGCSGFTQGSIKNAKKAIEEKNYTAALQYLREAKDAGADNSEVNLLTDIFDNYTAALELYNQGNLNEAKLRAEKIPQSASSYVFWSDISDLISRINSEIASNEINTRINEAKQLVANGNYENALSMIAAIETSALSESQKSELESLKMTANTALGQINSARISGEESGRAQTEAKIQDQEREARSNTVKQTMYVVKCNEFITLRRSPSTSAGEIVKIPLGSSVGYIEEAGNGFYKINYDGHIGYALASYLSTAREVHHTTASKTAKVVNAESFITLRSYPSTSASDITKIPADSYVTYIETVGDFYKIEYKGMVGYGLASYLAIQ